MIRLTKLLLRPMAQTGIFETTEVACWEHRLEGVVPQMKSVKRTTKPDGKCLKMPGVPD